MSSDEALRSAKLKGQRGLPSNWLLTMWWCDCYIARHESHPKVIYFLKVFSAGFAGRLVNK